MKGNNIMTLYMKCSQQNDDTVVNCISCGNPLRDPAAPSPSNVVQKRFPLRMVIGIVGCIILFLYIAYRISEAMNALP